MVAGKWNSTSSVITRSFATSFTTNPRSMRSRGAFAKLVSQRSSLRVASTYTLFCSRGYRRIRTCDRSRSWCLIQRGETPSRVLSWYQSTSSSKPCGMKCWHVEPPNRQRYPSNTLYCARFNCLIAAIPDRSPACLDGGRSRLVPLTCLSRRALPRAMRHTPSSHARRSN